MRYWCAVGLAVATTLAACKQDPSKLKAEYTAKGDAAVAVKKYSEATIEYRNAIAADPRFGEAHFKLAAAYAEMGELRSALIEYVRAADLMPQDVEAQLRAGSGLLNVGSYPEARARALAALEKEPKNLRALILLGNALGSMKEFDAAIERVEQAVDADPAEVLAYSNLGALQLATGNRQAAESAFKRAVDANPNSAEAHLAVANYYWSAGQRAEAKRELENALRLDPKSASATRGLAVFSAANGQVDDAERYLKSYVDLSGALDARLALADLYVRRQKTSDAEQLLGTIAEGKEGFAPATLRLAALDFLHNRRPRAYERTESVLKQDSGNAAALLQKGKFLFTEAKFAEANVVAKQLVGADPGSPQAQYLLGLTQRATGARAEALKTFETVLKLSPASTPVFFHLADLQLALQNPKAAADYAAQAVKGAPLSSEAHLLFGQALLREGDFKGAEREAAILSRATPQRADISAFRGRVYLRQKDSTRARAAFEQALALPGGSFDALSGLVTIDLTERRPAAAIKTLDAALAKTPNDGAVLMLSGQAYVALGDVKQAEARFRQALAADPSNFEVYGRLAELYRTQNRLDEAKHEFEEYGKQKPEFAAATTTMIGTILELQNNRGDAIKHYQRALELDATLSLAGNNLAWLLAQDGRLDEALAIAQKAKAQAPDSGSVNDTLGWIYYKKGLVPSAVTALEEAAKQAPNTAEVHYHLGLAYAKQGDKMRAQRSFEQALKLNANFNGAEDARKQLQELKG